MSVSEVRDRRTVIRPTPTAWMTVYFLEHFDPGRRYWVLGASRVDGSEDWRTFHGPRRAEEATAWIAECYARGCEVCMWIGDVREPLSRRPTLADTEEVRFVAAHSTAASVANPAGFISDTPAWPHAVYHGLSGCVEAVWKLEKPIPAGEYRKLASRYAYMCCNGKFAALPRHDWFPLPANHNPPSMAGGCLVRAPHSGRSPIPLGAKQSPAVLSAAVRQSVTDPRAPQLVRVLQAMGFNGTIKDVKSGPVITQYIYAPASGTRGTGIIERASDIARELEVDACSVISQAGGLSIELPNINPETVTFQGVLRATKEKRAKMALPVALGLTAVGDPVAIDVEQGRHWLVAGASGGGKSVALNTIILSLLCELSPDQCRFVMIDPKMLELTPYEDIPHLARPVATDVPQAIEAMEWVVAEMLARAPKFKAVCAKSLPQYNAKVPGDALPYVICVIDEYADLVMMDDKLKRAERAIKRVAQMGRALGIYLLVATQKPIREVIDTVIKANFVTRTAFQVVSKTDSGVILDQSGAENLHGRGDSLFMYCGRTPYRVHVAYSDDADLTEIIASVKEKYGTADFGDDVDFVSDDESSPNVFDTTPMGGGDREAVKQPDFGSQRGDKKKRAVQWLDGMLKENGPTPSSLLYELASQQEPPIAATTLFEASKELDVQKTNPSPDGKYKVGQSQLWSLRC